MNDFPQETFLKSANLAQQIVLLSRKFDMLDEWHPDHPIEDALKAPGQGTMYGATLSKRGLSPDDLLPIPRALLNNAPPTPRNHSTFDQTQTKAALSRVMSYGTPKSHPESNLRPVQTYPSRYSPNLHHSINQVKQPLSNTFSAPSASSTAVPAGLIQHTSLQQQQYSQMKCNSVNLPVKADKRSFVFKQANGETFKNDAQPSLPGLVKVPQYNTPDRLVHSMSVPTSVASSGDAIASANGQFLYKTCKTGPGYTCLKCNYFCVQKQLMAKHCASCQSNSTAKRLFHCRFCSKTFSRREAVQRHEDQGHKQPDFMQDGSSRTNDDEGKPKNSKIPRLQMQQSPLTRTASLPIPPIIPNPSPDQLHSWSLLRKTQQAANRVNVPAVPLDLSMKKTDVTDKTSVATAPEILNHEKKERSPNSSITATPPIVSSTSNNESSASIDTKSAFAVVGVDEEEDLSDCYYLEEKDGEEVYCCLSCEITETSLSAIARHILSTHSKPFKCRHCNQSFQKAKVLRMHMGSKHSDKSNEKSSIGEDAFGRQRPVADDIEEIRRVNDVGVFRAASPNGGCSPFYGDNNKTKIGSNAPSPIPA